MLAPPVPRFRRAYHFAAAPLTNVGTLTGHWQTNDSSGFGFDVPMKVEPDSGTNVKSAMPVELTFSAG
jgi:hypothetical protein